MKTAVQIIIRLEYVLNCKSGVHLRDALIRRYHSTAIGNTIIIKRFDTNIEY